MYTYVQYFISCTGERRINYSRKREKMRVAEVQEICFVHVI